MDTDKLVEQLLRGAALQELLSELPYATAASVTERLQQEAERYWTIDPHRSLEFADRIVAIGQARADPRQSALGLIARGDALKFMGREVEAWEAFQLARNMLLAPGEEVGRAQALISSLSQLLAQRHANLQAQARVEAESDSAISLQRLLLRINSRIAHLYKQISDHLQAQARVEAESDSAISLQRLLLRIDLGIANLYKQMGDHLQALHHYQTAIATAEALGENQYLTSLYMNLGLTYIGLGDAPQALANLERARRTLSITGNQKIETEACHNARKSLKDMLLGRVLESDELHQAEAHVVTCPFCQLRLQLLAMEILMHPEGNCSIWRDRLHDYVEAQLAGHEEDPEFMELRRHLDTCVDCADVYALLYETMWAEQQGAIPELFTMPTLDTSFLSSESATDPLQHGLLDHLRSVYQKDDRLVSENVSSPSRLVANTVFVQEMAAADLAQKCAQEMDLYFRHHDYDSSYCFELFRRAIQDNDERALEVVILQYQPLVARWVDRWMAKHPDFSLANEESQDFIAQAFERFWISFTPGKFEKSQSLAAVLRYLQMCVNGAMTDAWQKWRRLQLEQEPGDEEQDYSEPEATPEDLFQKEEFWQLIKKKSKDPKEYTVMYASFSLALSPREILAEYPGVFSDVKEIYQHKNNLLNRLELSGSEEDREIRDHIINNKGTSDK